MSEPETTVAKRKRPSKFLYELLQVDFRELPKAQRKEMIAAYKAERSLDPKVEWAEWISRPANWKC